MRPPRRAGMTLVELLVTLAVMGIVIAGIAQALGAFQTIYTVQSYKRQASSAGRQGLSAIDRDLRSAGFGMEPALAFDFGIYQGEGLPCPNPAATNPCIQPNNAVSRDRTDGPDSLVFYSREPNYWGGDAAGEPEGWAWQVVGPGAANQIVLKGHVFVQTLRPGQILQLVCAGASDQAYVTVGALSASSGNDDQNFTVTLFPDSASDPFRQNTLALAGGSCFIQPTARAFMINRYRYFVNPAVTLPDTSTDSFLMLDTGLDRNNDNLIDAADDIPVARGVVDMQIGYMRPKAGTPGANAEVGTALTGTLLPCAVSVPAAPPVLPLSGQLAPVACASGLRIIDFTTGAARYAQYSYLPAAPTSALRQSEDLANSGAVHVVLVARSEGAVRALAATRAPATMNRTVLSIPADLPNKPYAYSVQETMVPVRNVIAASMLSYL